MRQIKLYNVLFPVWFLMMLPQLWLIVLPGNFLIDSIVLLLIMYSFKMDGKRGFYKKSILKIFLFGLLSDAIGAGLLLLSLLTGISQMGDEFYITIPAIALSAALIFVFDYCIAFKELEKRERFCAALTFAIVTAPYTFAIPSSLIYGF